jgi:hypothetical protein
MGFPTLEVGYSSVTTGKGDHEVHKGYVVALEKKILTLRRTEQDIVINIHRSSGQIPVILVRF